MSGQLLILKREHLRRPIQLLGFELEMLTALYHRIPKMTQLQVMRNSSYCDTHGQQFTLYSSLVRASLSARSWPNISVDASSRSLLQISPTALTSAQEGHNSRPWLCVHRLQNSGRFSHFYSAEGLVLSRSEEY